MKFTFFWVPAQPAKAEWTLQISSNQVSPEANSISSAPQPLQNTENMLKKTPHSNDDSNKSWCLNRPSTTPSLFSVASKRNMKYITVSRSVMPRLLQQPNSLLDT